MIWNERARAERIGLTRLETSDTELIVRSLTEALEATTLRAGLRVFPPREEADKGADLEIWLGLGDGLSIGFTIQAKRTTFSRTRLLSAATILQASGTVGRNLLQLDDLIEHGRKVEANPMHLLYSGWNDPATDDPLVRGRGTPTQFGASVLPTWWFRAARGWGNRTGVGQARVDLLSDITLPFEWLLKPEDIRQSSGRVQRSHPWFGKAFQSELTSGRTRHFLSSRLPFDRRSFPEVASLLGSALGVAAPSDELVDYAVLGIGMGSAEYGPTASTGVLALREPYDFGLSRTPPAYVPDVGLGSGRAQDEPVGSRDPAPDHDLDAGDEEGRRDQRNGPSMTDPDAASGARQSRVFVDIVTDPEKVIEWQLRSEVEAAPRIVLAIA